MKRSIKIKPEGIMNLHEARRYVSAPDPAAEEHEYLLNLFNDALDRRIIPPNTSFERFKKELHNYDYSSRLKKPSRMYAKADEPFDPIKEAVKLHLLRQQLTPDQLLVVDDLVEKMTKPPTDKEK